MNQILDIRSNAIYNVEPGGKKLDPAIEIVIIHTNGKRYFVADKGREKGKLMSENLLSETRFLISPRTLTEVIGDLKLLQQNMTALESNAAGLNNIMEQFSNADASDNQTGDAQ